MANELAKVPDRQPTVGEFISATLSQGVTESTVAVIERLCALRERENAQQAERDFAAAFARLQANMPQIVASKIVPGKQEGSVRYKYAPYEEIMTKARPTLTECGFAITFDTQIVDKSVIVTCTLIHTSGHSRSNKFQCRIGQGPPMSSEAQGDGAATTYAKRFALCAALNIVVESDDTDGRNVGDTTTISEEQAAELKLGCEETKTDPKKFCEWLAGEGATFADIKAVDWKRATDKLKERGLK